MFSKLRTTVSWIVGFLVGFVVNFLGIYISPLLGAPHQIDNGLDQVTTTHGWGWNLISILAGVAAWYAVQGRRGGVENERYFLAWGIAATILTIGGAILWKMFAGQSGILGLLGNACDLILCLAAWYAGYWFYKREPPSFYW